MSFFGREFRPSIHRVLRKLWRNRGSFVAFGLAGIFLAAVVFFAVEGADNHGSLNRPWIQTSPNDAVMPAQPYMDDESFYEDSDFWWGVGAGYMLSGSGGTRHYSHDRPMHRTTGRHNTRSSTHRRR